MKLRTAILLALCLVPMICLAYGGIDPVDVFWALLIVLLCIIINVWALVDGIKSRHKHLYIFWIAALTDVPCLLLLSYGIYYDILELEKYQTPGAYSSEYMQLYPLDEMVSDLWTISFIVAICVALLSLNIFFIVRATRKKVYEPMYRQKRK